MKTDGNAPSSYGYDFIGGLFQPDAVAPAQYFSARNANALLQPEKRLMFAILEDALDCFQTNHRASCGKTKRLFDAVQEWFFGANDSIFAFESICDVLDLNHDYIRGGLRRWRDQQQSDEGSTTLVAKTKTRRRAAVARCARIVLTNVNGQIRSRRN